MVHPPTTTRYKPEPLAHMSQLTLEEADDLDFPEALDVITVTAWKLPHSVHPSNR